jgi:GNAT superfamily N-acetyltransferase
MSSGRRATGGQGVRIRPATLDDREALCRLFHEFHQFHASALPGRLRSLGDPPPSYAGTSLWADLAALIEGESSTLLVAEAGDRLVGLAEAHLGEDAAHPLRVPRRYGWLQSLMVHEPSRRQGLGSRLLEAAQAWARERGASEMRLDTWEFAGAPLGFYAAQGYRTLRRTWVREL